MRPRAVLRRFGPLHTGLMHSGVIITLVVAVGVVPGAYGLQIYHEDFWDETEGFQGFPTTPEVDPFGLGSFGPYSEGNGPPPLPAINATIGTVPLSVQGSSGLGPLEASGIVVCAELTLSCPGTPLTLLDPFDDLEVSGTFTNFSSSIIGEGAVQINFGIIVTDVPGTRVGVNAILLDAVVPDFGWDGMLLFVNEQFVENPDDSDHFEVEISADLRSAILAGAPFKLVLFVDRQLGTAVATLAVGLDQISTLAFPLTRLNDLASQDSINLFNVNAFQHNFLAEPEPDIELGRDDAISVDLLEVRALVPEPSATLLRASALALLAALAAQRSRRGIRKGARVRVG